MIMMMMMMMMIIIIIIIIIIIAFKGTVRDFFTISTLRRELSLTRTLKQPRHSSVCKSRATQLAPITCNVSCATWYEGTAQLLGLTELKSHLL